MSTTSQSLYPSRRPRFASLSSAELQQRLAHFNEKRFRPGFIDEDWRTDLAEELEMRELEGEMVEAARADLAEQIAAVPEDADAFMDWFEGLRDTGPGQNDALFPWLATRASMEAMRWFVSQEIGGEAGFDDLVALAQVRLPAQPKLEMARNYWDEMGRGQGTWHAWPHARAHRSASWGAGTHR